MLTRQAAAPELMQCSVFISRPNDDIFNWRVTDSGNNDQASGQGIVTSATGTFTDTGLPIDLVVGKTGSYNFQLTSEYGVQNHDADWLAWTSDEIGDGRGLATDNGQPHHYCICYRPVCRFLGSLILATA